MVFNEVERLRNRGVLFQDGAPLTQTGIRGRRLFLGKVGILVGELRVGMKDSTSWGWSNDIPAKIG